MDQGVPVPKTKPQAPTPPPPPPKRAIDPATAGDTNGLDAGEDEVSTELPKELRKPRFFILSDKPPPRASPTRSLLRERELDNEPPFTQGCQSKKTERLPPSAEIPWCPTENSRLMARERVRDAQFPDEGEEEIQESPTRRQVIDELARRGHPTTYPNPDYWPLKPTPLKPPKAIREPPEDTEPKTPTDQDPSVSPIEQRAEQDTAVDQILEPKPTGSPRPARIPRPVIPPTEKRWGISPDGKPKEVNSDEPDSDSKNS
ncbi:hypothetical protein FQN50_002597 [Emmonsiellopsis sp. PD_5]|nr:hypothetical protein FQN50_002597 [Emmonsiellopsis sp. PD_5]